MASEPIWRLPQIWAAFLLALLASTYRLWIPEGPLPAVPLLELPPPWSAGVGWLSIAALACALIISLFRTFAAAWWIIAASLATACLLDQHRLQPWAYQSMIYAVIFASHSAAQARRWVLPVAISIYLYSGLGKLDYQFAHTIGQDMLDAAAAPLGGIPATWDGALRARIALALPATELIVGVCLIPRKLRRAAGVAVMIMHFTLIGLLGPWGLNHSWGVLIWNALLITQAWLLFVRPDARVSDGHSTRETTSSPDRPLASHLNPAAWFARGVVLLALFLPLTERWGYWDHWLSWALYAPHSSRVEAEIHQSRLESLDVSMLDSLDEDDDADGWRHINLGRWSLDALGAPLYPQARYQLDLIREVVGVSDRDDGIRASIQGPADRLTGKRETQFVIGARELDQAARKFWLSRPEG